MGRVESIARVTNARIVIRTITVETSWNIKKDLERIF